VEIDAIGERARQPAAILRDLRCGAHTRMGDVAQVTAWTGVCDTPTLAFAKPKRHYPLALLTLGDHLLKRRLDLGHTRKFAASLIGVDPESLKNWEDARTEPAVGFFPRLISYLGYNPLPEAENRGSQIRRERISRGLSRKALADSVGVDEGTVKRMEEDVKGMARRAIRAICHELDVEM